MTETLQIKIADGRITEWRGSANTLLVVLSNWQDNPISIGFEGVSAVLAVLPEGIDLSHLERSDTDPLLAQVVEHDEEASGLFAFRFLSAWDQRPVLTVVASRCCLQENMDVRERGNS